VTIESRLAGAIERAKQQAAKVEQGPSAAPPRPRPAGSGRPPLARKGLSETEQIWSKILTDPRR
jgi:hypothetical protein